LGQWMRFLPVADAVLRQRLDDQAAEQGWPAMHRWLADVDPVSASRLKPGDKQRIQRALEVYHLTGQPLSYWHAHGKTDSSLPYRLHWWALIPKNRAWLHAAIARRLDVMWQTGLVDEVTALWQRGDLHADLPSMRAVGYRQVWQYLDGQTTEQDMQQHVLFATRQLAKRQLTWLRSFSGLSCWDPQLQSVEDIVMQLLKNFA
ncbi:MAG: tRNA (adenosine(37)-N6)-dimethylallyltransferase MiaA, partial [Pseudomonadales bacterium]|nr:tRNA (adenosine(37)-N6)-dimethylallyltransferase MiaA [Pseudomonadales bacterium]